jgi:hypothetical protein
MFLAGSSWYPLESHSLCKEAQRITALNEREREREREREGQTGKSLQQ